MKKIVSFSNLDNILKRIKSKRKVLVGGCFDLIHYGHFSFLINSKKQGDLLIIALESNEFIKKKKGKGPIHNQIQRAKILSGFSFVDLVILLPYLEKDKEYFSLVTKIKPQVIAVTKEDEQIENKKRQAEQVGAKVKTVVSLLKGLSSSCIYNLCH